MHENDYGDFQDIQELEGLKRSLQQKGSCA